MNRTDRLEEQLTELDLTNADLARLVEVAPSSVQRWTSGTIVPPVMLIKLLDCMITLKRVSRETRIEA
jgi:hypothetical protein